MSELASNPKHKTNDDVYYPKDVNEMLRVTRMHPTPGISPTTGFMRDLCSRLVELEAAVAELTRLMEDK